MKEDEEKKQNYKVFVEKFCCFVASLKEKKDSLAKKLNKFIAKKVVSSFFS